MHIPRNLLPPEIKSDVRKEFVDLALLHAVLVDRAGSENFLRTKVLPEGFEVVTRQRHMEILRQHALYDRLGTAERDLLLLPDGHWTEAMVDQVLGLLEPLRLLRWILRVDGFLPLVGATMDLDFRLAGSLVKDPGLLAKDDRLATIDDIRTGFTAADHFFYRCWAEGVRRKLYTEGDPEAIAKAAAYAERLNGNEGEDMLLRTTIVSRAPDADVRLGTALSLRRARVLDWVKRRYYDEEPAHEQLVGL